MVVSVWVENKWGVGVWGGGEVSGGQMGGWCVCVCVWGGVSEWMVDK